jgi:hypothetical protein
LLTGGEVYEYHGTARGHAANYRNEITADTGYAVVTLDLANAATLLGPDPRLARARSKPGRTWSDRLLGLRGSDPIGEALWQHLRRRQP